MSLTNRQHRILNEVKHLKRQGLPHQAFRTAAALVDEVDKAAVEYPGLEDYTPSETLGPWIREVALDNGRTIEVEVYAKIEYDDWFDPRDTYGTFDDQGDPRDLSTNTVRNPDAWYVSQYDQDDDGDRWAKRSGHYGYFHPEYPLLERIETYRFSYGLSKHDAWLMAIKTAEEMAQDVARGDITVLVVNVFVRFDDIEIGDSALHGVEFGSDSSNAEEVSYLLDVIRDCEHDALFEAKEALGKMRDVLCSVN